ncbi:SAVED domain-containing protein [Xanthomonas arboricola]|uniref:SAVED domain-containing protein n=1 Tax=Xanthomonas arboricola TaxID=56448 RepID=UPI002B2E951D|nr:SAVED domain-containing protein [Xanthomonas arboricola]
MAAQVKQQRPAAVDSTVHLFVAGPNAFAFFLGQQRHAMGPMCLYEFDFDGRRDRSYRASLTLPIEAG